MESKPTHVTNKDQIQQGDVGLERIDKIPADAVRLPHRTLAEGEATGHHHTFVEDEVELYERDGVLYANNPLDKEAHLEHQTHGTITASPGRHLYRPRQEMDHLAQVARRVVD